MFELPQLAKENFFVVMYERNRSPSDITVNPNVFTAYNEALHARCFRHPFTDSFLRGFTTREEAAAYINNHEIAKDVA